MLTETKGMLYVGGFERPLDQIRVRLQKILLSFICIVAPNADYEANQMTSCQY